jgi:hypothetical protein
VVFVLGSQCYSNTPLTGAHSTLLPRISGEPTEADPCIYVRRLKGLTSFIALYVDDCTIIAHRSQVREIKEMIKRKFPTKDLGEAKSILGFKIHCDCSQGCIYILQ